MTQIEIPNLSCHQSTSAATAFHLYSESGTFNIRQKYGRKAGSTYARSPRRHSLAAQAQRVEPLGCGFEVDGKLTAAALAAISNARSGALGSTTALTGGRRLDAP